MVDNNILTFQKRNIFGCPECGSIDFQIEASGEHEVQRISGIICSNTSCRTVYETDLDG